MYRTGGFILSVGLSARNSDNAGRSFVKFYDMGGVKVKFSLKLATKPQRGSRVIALIFL